MHRPFLFLVSLLLTFGTYAQTDTIVDPTPQLNEQRLEDFLQDAEEDSEFDFNTVFEDLETYREHPLDLNKVDETDLRDLQLLSDVQIANLLSYRDELDGFLAIYELQVIPGFDLATIQRILPYVSINRGIDDFQASLWTMLSEGDDEIYLRWSRVLEQQRGYIPFAENPDSSAYLGDPNSLYFRYRHRNSNRLSYGLTAEKDRGEEFFRGSNTQGFDFYSAHFFLREYNRTVKAIALGDYRANFGQGLILFTGFGYGKSSLVTSIKRGGRTLSQYTSVNEANFLRGAATTLSLGDQWEVTALGSIRQRDGNLILLVDTIGLEIDGSFARFSSLNISGLHRTAAEIADENAVTHRMYGGSVKWHNDHGHLAANAVYHQLDKPLTLTPQPYNRFFFQGERLANVSADYSWRWRNLSFFGETAWSDNGAIATLNGLLATLDRRVDLALFFRSFPRNYQALLADPFAETSGGRNETGMYVGLEVSPAKHWKVAAYYDTWYHPWIRFNVDAPSKGSEYRLRLTYFQKRRLEAYVELRDETKGINIRLLDNNVDAVLPNRRFQARFHFSYNLGRGLRWRSRIDWGFTNNEINDRQDGVAIYQDLLYYPVGSPWVITTRFALFDTDSYQVRFYNYENGLLYNFRIPAYYNQGSRFYINVRYKGIPNMTIEARYARLYWSNQESIGGSWENTGQPTRTEVGAQIKYQF